MGSGTNRRFWSALGSRTARRRATKTLNGPNADKGTRDRMKARRAEAARRSQEGTS